MSEPGSLASALVAAQAAMPTVKKDETNPHFKSRFVSLDGLIAATRPKLNEHGLAIVQFPTVSELGQPVLRTILIHGPSGEQLEADTPLVGNAENMQQLGAAITYARRYAWASVLGIASEEDNDGNGATATPPPAKRARRKVGPKTISDQQRRRLFAIAKDNHVEPERLRELVVQVTGDPSTEALTVAHYEQIVKLLEPDLAAWEPTMPPATVETEEERKKRLQRRLVVLIDKAETDGKMLLPQGQDSWDGYAKWLGTTQYGVEHLGELSADQLADLVDQIQAQMVPF